MTWQRFAGLMGTRRWPLLLFLIGFAHSSAYALSVPLWQAPDEPGHYEAACLLGQRQRPLTGDDLSPDLQREILTNLAQHDFWTQVQASQPRPLPASLAADPFLARSGRQVGDEPPLYYVIPALICRTVLPIETQLHLIRLFGAVLFGLTGVAAAWGTKNGQTGRDNTRQQKKHVRASLTNGRNQPGSWSAYLLLDPLPLLLVLLPMPAFIAGSTNNDALAMLTATATFAAVLRVQRLGWTWPRGAGIVLLAALSLASKKTNTFLLIWLVLLGIASAWQAATRRGWRCRTVAGALLLTTLALTILILPSNGPSSWRSSEIPGPVHFVEPTDPAAANAPGPRVLHIADRSTRSYERLFQTLTGTQAAALRGQTVRATAWVRSPNGSPASGRITLRDTAGVSQTGFVAGPQWQPVSISHTVALTTTHLKLALAAGHGLSKDEVGELLVTDAKLVADDTANLLRNGDFARPARWGELWLIAPLEERWQQFAPRLQADDGISLATLRRQGLYALLTFAGFWGNFGWLQKPLPIWVYAVLAAVCLVAAIGLLRFFRRPPSGPTRISRTIVVWWLVATGLALGQAFLPMLGRPWQPQGRYLFPALLPITGLLLVGLDAWLDFDRHPRRLVPLVAGEICLAILSLMIATRH